MPSLSPRISYIQTVWQFTISSSVWLAWVGENFYMIVLRSKIERFAPVHFFQGVLSNIWSLIMLVHVMAITRENDSILTVLYFLPSLSRFGWYRARSITSSKMDQQTLNVKSPNIANPSRISNIVVGNPDELAKKKAAIRAAGMSSLQVLWFISLHSEIYRYYQLEQCCCVWATNSVIFCVNVSSSVESLCVTLGSTGAYLSSSAGPGWPIASSV